LELDANHEDQNHHAFGAELLRGLKNHLWQANLHVCAENLDLMDDVHQSALDALRVLDY
jgi:hypothetical protein